MILKQVDFFKYRVVEILNTRFASQENEILKLF